MLTNHHAQGGGRQFLGALRVLRYVHAFVGTVAAIVFVVIIAEKTLVTFIPVRGVSMQPTLQDGQIVALYRQSAWNNTFIKGQVVIIQSEQDSSVRFVKRIAGLAGDIVEIAGRSEIVPAGKVYVLGDNRDASTDSRVYGLISVSRIMGTVIGQPVLDPAQFEPLQVR
jgi:signal peptidase I